jgi:hypothetical protein
MAVKIKSKNTWNKAIDKFGDSPKTPEDYEKVTAIYRKLGGKITVSENSKLSEMLNMKSFSESLKYDMIKDLQKIKGLNLSSSDKTLTLKSDIAGNVKKGAYKIILDYGVDSKHLNKNIKLPEYKEGDKSYKITFVESLKEGWTDDIKSTLMKYISNPIVLGIALYFIAGKLKKLIK